MHKLIPWQLCADTLHEYFQLLDNCSSPSTVTYPSTRDSMTVTPGLAGATYTSGGPMRTFSELKLRVLPQFKVCSNRLCVLLYRNSSRCYIIDVFVHEPRSLS